MSKKAEVVGMMVSTLALGLTVGGFGAIMFYGRNFQPAILWVLIGGAVVNYLSLAIRLLTLADGGLVQALNTAFATAMPIIYYLVNSPSH